MSLKKYCRKLLKVILGNRNQASLRGWDSQYLNKLADHFHSVIDIGVANGTPELYEAFPNKKVVLIEPLVEYKTTLEKFDKTRFKTIYKALGGKPDIIDINVNRESITKSS